MISSVGLLVVDLTLEVDHLPEPGESLEAGRLTRSLGGKAANQVVAAARLGATTSFIGTVGAPDAHIDPLLELHREGVDVRHAHRSDAENGLSVILLAPDGGQFIATYPGPGFRLDASSVQRALAELETGILLLQGETDWSAASQIAREFEGTVILDPSPVHAFLDSDLSFVDILTPNEGEAAALCGGGIPSAAEVRRRTGAACVLVTLGDRGVELSDREGSVRIPAPPAAVLDPTGAGDAFSGALAAALDSGASVREASAFAVEVAAISVSRMHCIPSYPSREELRQNPRLPLSLQL